MLETPEPCAGRLHILRSLGQVTHARRIVSAQLRVHTSLQELVQELFHLCSQLISCSRRFHLSLECRVSCEGLALGAVGNDIAAKLHYHARS